MAACASPCGGPERPVDPVYRRVLWAALLINGAMFLIEGSGSLFGRSVALQADAIDFLGDAAAYGISLFVLARPLRWRAAAALIKGSTMGLFGIAVLGNAFYHLLAGTVPHAWTMGGIGTLALIANLATAGLLLGFRRGDSNMRAVWLCSRNDAIGNVAVVVAASGVFATASGWPDVAVALILATLALTACRQILRQALRELRGAPVAVPAVGDD